MADKQLFWPMAAVRIRSPRALPLIQLGSVGSLERADHLSLAPVFEALPVARLAGEIAMTMSVEAAAQALREATRETVRRYSFWYLVQGVLMVIAGIVALLYPFVSSVALVLFLGWILIISGIVQGISLIGAQNAPNFWLQLVSAVLSIIVGVLFLRRPGEAVVTLALLLIVFFMVEGFAKIVFSLTIRPLPNWGWVLASGIVGILLSFYLLANLTTTAVWLLGVLLGIQLICEGVALSSLAWQVRRSA